MVRNRVAVGLLILAFLGAGFYSLATSQAIGNVAAYPNPFNPDKYTLTIKPTTTATFDGTISFIVYDFNQKQVYAGGSVTNSTITWSGHDDSGIRVAPGLYFIKLIQTFTNGAVGVKYIKLLVH